MNYRDALKDKKTIVLKVGTSSLTYPNGRLNFERITHLTDVISKLRKMGKNVVLVSSGSIAVGTGKMGGKSRPKSLRGKQAAAAIGQAVLMKMYQKFFALHGIVVAQILLTYDVITEEDKNLNARNTFAKLMEMGVVTVVNENDSIATDEIVIGDNDRLSAMVATLCNADLLVLLSDIDGLFTADPKKDPTAVRRSVVEEISDEIEASATGAGSQFGTGGMATKIMAAHICFKAGIDIVIANGEQPNIVLDILEGKDIGTLFVAKKIKE